MPPTPACHGRREDPHVRALLSTGQRDRSRTLLTVLSTVLAAATVAGTGVATAAAAQETARSNAEKAQKQAAAAEAHRKALLKWAEDNPVVVTKARPKKTVIGPPTLVKASGTCSARVGGGSSSSSSSSSTTTRSRPAPPPPPAPKSTGS